MASDIVAKTDKADPEPEAPSPRRTRSRARKAGWVSLISLLVVALAVGVAIVLAIGQRISAPEWLRDRIEARIEQNLNGMQIAFGEVSLVILQGWRPRVRLRDVTLRDPDGQLIAQLSDAEASLAMRPLLRGQVQPKRVVLSGALATLRRDARGNVALTVGNAAAPVEQAAGLPQLIEAWDQLFLRPQLSALVAVEIEAITLRYEDARQGRAWTLDGGSIRLVRNGDQLRISAGFSLLSGRDYASAVEANYSSRIGDPQATFGFAIDDIAAQDIAAQGVALAWLDVLRAPISGALRGGIDSDGALAPLSATLQIGAGSLQPTDQTTPIPFRGARGYFTYDPSQQVLRFDELSVDSDWGSGVAEGSAWLGGIENGRLNDLIGQFTLTGLNINPADVYPEPLVLNGAEADFRLELNPFRFTLGAMNISDPDGTLLLAGTLDAGEKGWRLSLDGQMDTLSHPRLMALWPEVVIKKPRKWVQKNLSDGVFSNLSFGVRARPGQKPNIYAGFDFDDATIRFLKTMPPITGAAGHASLNGLRFVTTATAGKVTAEMGGALDISGTSFIIPDVSIKRGAPGVVRFTGQGAVTAILSLLNRPPLRVLRDTPLPVDVAQGHATVSGTLALPLKDKVQFDEMEFHLKGQITDVSSTLLVPGQTVTAPVMQIEGDQGHLALFGKGRIGQVPVTARWQRAIGKGAPKESQLTGEIELSPLLIDTFGIGLPKGSVTGRGSGDFVLDLVPGKAPTLSLRSDLRGVGLRLPQLGWAKPKKSSGKLELAGTLGDATRIERLVVEAAGLKATGTVQNRPGGGLDRARLDTVRLGGWFDASVELVGRGKAAPELRILDGTLDMRRATFGSGGSESGSESGGGGETGPLQVRLKRLQVTDTIALHDFTGQFTTKGALAGPFSGLLNGKTRVAGNLVPRGARSAVLIESDDAGGVFRSSGLLSQAHGGKFKMTLLPVKEAQYDGTVHITNTKVKDGPAIAALLNAISVVGLLDELAGQGIQFTKVEARFRLGPSRLTLYESSAVGPSIGVSMDGTYDVVSGVLDMQGAISPLYLVNAIGSVLTRKGEGVIAFTYRLRGTSDAPSVKVNPLSGLAPGMLRDLFRKNPRPREDGETGKGKQRRGPTGADGTAGGR